MKFYLASSFRNIASVRMVAEQLRRRGYTQTFDWTAYKDIPSLTELGEIGQIEINAVLDADLFIMMMPAGKGSHVELGLALGHGKRIIIYSPTDEIYDLETTSTFYHLKEVSICIGGIEELIAHIGAEDRSGEFSSMPYTIRPIEQRDIPFLRDMLYESLFVPEGEQPFSKEIIHEPSLAKYVEAWGREGDFGFIAMNDDGKSVGSITARYFDQNNQGYGYISDDVPEIGMAVIAENRGNGIGTALLTSLFEHARELNIRRLSLSVDPMNLAAMKLYQRFAFREVGKSGTSITMAAVVNES